ncbi:hypothetical protein [Thiomicrorhabdus aquaedulcis]|uniref:hypothetical protein n=1 Tax=Thiomicrorhabdus aquaedulcis TaxID=2211106 RepID=UPI000FD99273|nr:hypothetical protein [Thiomicrorhabdus aquaedulcis]
MLNLNFKRLGYLACLPIFIASTQGCSHLAEHEKVSQDVVQPVAMINEIGDAYNKFDKTKNEQYEVYEINIDGDDLSGFPSTENLTIDANAETSAKDYLSFITKKSPEISIVYNLENPNALEKTFSLSANNLPLKKFLELLEKVADLDFYFKDNVLYVSDFVILESVISKLESGEKGHYKKIKEYLESILVKNSIQANTLPPAPSSATDLGMGLGMDNKTITKVDQTYTPKKPTIIVDESTGTMHIKASPNSLRQSRKLIESYLNSSVGYATVELGIYRISNEKAREMGISVSKVIDNLYSLSSGTQATGIVNNTVSFERSVTENNGDVLKSGLQMYEKNGLISSESTTLLNIYNDVPTLMSDIQTTGYWIPGNLSENNTTLNGVSVVTYTEDKPEFVEEDVGKTLIFTPRISLDEQTINMSIDYTDSKIYATEVFTWKRNLSLGDVIEIKKPLKSENKLSSTITLNKENYSIFAGFKSKDGSIERQFIPGLGEIPVLNDIGANSVSAYKSDTIFIMKASFPEKAVHKKINKKFMF